MHFPLLAFLVNNCRQLAVPFFFFAIVPLSTRPLLCTSMHFQSKYSIMFLVYFGFLRVNRRTILIRLHGIERRFCCGYLADRLTKSVASTWCVSLCVRVSIFQCADARARKSGDLRRMRMSGRSVCGV